MKTRTCNHQALMIKDKKNGCRRYYDSDFPVDEALSAFAAFDESDLARGGRLLKTTEKNRVVLFRVSGPEGIRSFCAKEYRVQGWRSKLKAVVGYSRARTAWKNTLGLLARSIPTARPFALIQEKTGALGERSLFISEDLSRFPRIDYCILQHYPKQPGGRGRFSEKRKFISHFAHAIRELHNKGVYIGDLKAPNILVEETNAGCRFYFVDTDRISFDRPVSERRAIKNFAQIHTSIPWCMSRTDRLRFLLAYCGNDRLHKNHKTIIKRVLQESKKRLAVVMTPLE